MTAPSRIDARIPHTVAPRHDTGLNNVQLGMGLFLASEVMLFGGLLAAYVMLRLGAEQWPHGREDLDVARATVNTAVLLLSSVAIARALAACRRVDFGAFRRWMGLTALGGLVFLAIKASEYVAKITQGDLPSTNNALGIYFALTGVHALHVIGGVVVNAYLAGPGAAMWTSDRPRLTNRVAAAGWYWHFVDAVWLVLFVVLYWT